MSNNSIYITLNIDSIINEIRLTLSANPSTPFIIVEGDDDIGFFKHHCSNDVRIRESFKGKLGVYEILEKYADKNSVIGICDRDYDAAQLPAHVFSYDYSCLETMLFANKETTEAVFTQLGLKGNIFLENILTQLLYLSCLRKMSFGEHLAIRFDGLHISKIFDCTCGIKTNLLIMELQKINDKESLLNCEQTECIEAGVSSEHTIDSLLSITQGHDLISLVQCYHAHYFLRKGQTMSEKTIRALLYCTYAGKFNASKLYNDVLQYGQSANIKFWTA